MPGVDLIAGPRSDQRIDAHCFLRTQSAKRFRANPVDGLLQHAQGNVRPAGIDRQVTHDARRLLALRAGLQPGAVTGKLAVRRHRLQEVSRHELRLQRRIRGYLIADQPLRQQTALLDADQDETSPAFA